MSWCTLGLSRCSSFQQLLQECAHCSRALLQERPSTESMQAVILGLTARLHTRRLVLGAAGMGSWRDLQAWWGMQSGSPQEVPGWYKSSVQK